MDPETRPAPSAARRPGTLPGRRANCIFLLGLWALVLLTACSRSEAAPVATQDPALAAGKALFQRHCAACHSLEPDAVIVGPSLAGVADRAGERVAGLDARQYIQTSILRPDAYLVAGFDNLMPTTLAKEMTGEELDTLTAYLLTLK